MIPRVAPLQFGALPGLNDFSVVSCYLCIDSGSRIHRDISWMGPGYRWIECITSRRVQRLADQLPAHAHPAQPLGTPTALRVRQRLRPEAKAPSNALAAIYNSGIECPDMVSIKLLSPSSTLV